MHPPTGQLLEHMRRTNPDPSPLFSSNEMQNHKGLQTLVALFRGWDHAVDGAEVIMGRRASIRKALPPREPKRCYERLVTRVVVFTNDSPAVGIVTLWLTRISLASTGLP